MLVKEVLNNRISKLLSPSPASYRPMSRSPTLPRQPEIHLFLEPIYLRHLHFQLVAYLNHASCPSPDQLVLPRIKLVKIIR